MSKDEITVDLNQKMGQNSPSERDLQEYLNDIGTSALESALVKLTAELSTDEVSALGHYLENEPDMETLLNHLFTHHREFENILKKEVEAYQVEAQLVLRQN
jgi:hypothetical protein